MRHFATIMLAAALASVQVGMVRAEEKPKHTGQAYGYGAIGAVVGRGDSGAASQIGLGGEGIFYKGLGAGIDVGYLFPPRRPSAGFGTISPGVVYQFTRDQKTVPFVTGGYTLGFRDGTMNMVHFGGGATYWFSKRAGLRIEARDHVTTHTSRWHYFLLRVGISGR